ncbi:MAG: 30S ribosomal protein S10 [Candidatus Organicella extenuata]|jgi:small subunit ribosomal protein S10|uniref:Small ribosomal subunit protein uS10 n=1 Tax=Candidatus Organicella extenuata TaxID=2841811 RepID=A0AA51GE68_9BACT|nr:MAG: 30S ribosomal protein S10 [Candidatus Organicella extenuata]
MINNVSNQKIRITLKSYTNESVVFAIKGIIKTVKKTNSTVSGPVSLPTKIKRFVVNRSPHVDKKSMDIFEIKIYKKILDIFKPNFKTIDELKKLNLSAEVDINITL